MIDRPIMPMSAVLLNYTVVRDEIVICHQSLAQRYPTALKLHVDTRAPRSLAVPFEPLFFRRRLIGNHQTRYRDDNRNRDGRSRPTVLYIYRWNISVEWNSLLPAAFSLE